jgi:hypothetical protein
MFWRSRIRLWTTVRLAYSVIVIQAGYYNKLRWHPSTQFRFSFTVIIPTRSYITYAAETASLNKQRYKIFYCTGSISHLWSVSRHRFMDSFQPLCFDLLRRIPSCFRHVSSSLFLRAHTTAIFYSLSFAQCFISQPIPSKHSRIQNRISAIFNTDLFPPGLLHSQPTAFC